MNTDKPEVQESANLASDAKRENDEKPSAAKRALFKAAWVAPVIVAVALPRVGYAANISGGHGGSHHDTNDTPKGDQGNHFGQFKNKP